MSIEHEAAALVAAADPAAVAAVIAEFPEADCIGVRANWMSLNPHLGLRVPKAPAERAEYLARLIEQYQQALHADIARYHLLRDKGLAALSPQDICISSSGDPLAALRVALRLKHAHISYDLSVLVKLSLELEDTQAALSKSASPQLALF